MIPLAVPAIAAMPILSFVFFQNNFLWPPLYPQNTPYTPFRSESCTLKAHTRVWSLKVAALSLAAWPPIFIYILFHRRIQHGLTAGALKF